MLANERPLVLRMFHFATERPVIATPSGARISDGPGSLPSPSLESRLGLLHRRRRLAFLKHLLATMSPVLVGMSLLLLIAAFGAVAGLR
jgi:hypothetical protein